MVGLQSRLTRNRFRELAAQGRQGAAAWNRQRAESAARKAHQLVPKLSGDLDSTIKAAPNRRTGSASLIAGGVAKSGKVVDYADDVEYGTRHAAAQPYMTPAVESEKKEMRNRPVRMFKG